MLKRFEIIVVQVDETDNRENAREIYGSGIRSDSLDELKKQIQQVVTGNEKLSSNSYRVQYKSGPMQYTLFVFDYQAMEAINSVE